MFAGFGGYIRMNIKEKIIEKLEGNEIHKEVFCDKCNKLIPRQFRFTDWENDLNDVFGDWDFCFEWYEKAIEEEPEGRFSIYAVTICDDCDSMLEDEGVLFNENCGVYNE